MFEITQCARNDVIVQLNNGGQV